MTPWVEVDEVRSRTPEGQYLVALTVRQSSGIPAAVFVLDTATGAFSHVGVADDLDTIAPTDRDAARTAVVPRYRATGFAREFPTPRSLGLFLDHVYARLLELTRTWAGESPWAEPGTRRVVVGGEEPEVLT